jgi:formylglycine-generating enzyme required for sulfatase activity
MRVYHRDILSPPNHDIDIGFRCARSDASPGTKDATPAATQTLESVTATEGSISTKTPLPEPTKTPSPAPVIVTDDYGVSMALIPAGMFEMGSEDGEDNEQPIHIVSLDDYYIDQYEVTNARYAECVDAGECDRPKNIRSATRNKYYGDPAYDESPVIYVDWDDARTYCAWRDARLPTEAEWEKAARGGLDGAQYPWGDELPDCLLANFASTVSCVGDTDPVGSYAPNGYGLYDMAGNVWEWAQSLYLNYPYNAADGRENLNATGQRAVRGGSWLNSGYNLRAAYRGLDDPSVTLNITGFRCARLP